MSRPTSSASTPPTAWAGPRRKARTATDDIKTAAQIGVDFVAVLLVARSGIKGGETRVFDANGPRGQRFTLDAPWSMLLMDDARVIHESTPIQPIDDFGHRDTLVLTYRAAAFLGDDPG